MRYLFFQHEDCGVCKEIMDTKIWDHKKSEIEVIDARSDEGLALANNFGIRSSPALVQLEDGSPQKIEFGSSCLGVIKRI